MKITQSLKRGMAACFTFCLLYGCGTAPPPPTPLPIVQPDQQVNIDQRQLIKCPQLPKLTVAPYNQAQSLNIMAIYATIYDMCRRRQTSLSDLTSDAFNLPRQPEPLTLPPLTPNSTVQTYDLTPLAPVPASGTNSGQPSK